MSAALFDPGRLLATVRAIEAFDELWRTDCLLRHLRADWGDVDPSDARANQEALQDGSRLVSAYVHPATRGRLLIITEAVGDDGQRPHTTLLLPQEY